MYINKYCISVIVIEQDAYAPIGRLGEGHVPPRRIKKKHVKRDFKNVGNLFKTISV